MNALAATSEHCTALSEEASVWEVRTSYMLQHSSYLLRKCQLTQSQLPPYNARLFVSLCQSTQLRFCQQASYATYNKNVAVIFEEYLSSLLQCVAISWGLPTFRNKLVCCHMLSFG
jgi:hypothetical protein